jgi:TonB family protein
MKFQTIPRSNPKGLLMFQELSFQRSRTKPVSIILHLIAAGLFVLLTTVHVVKPVTRISQIVLPAEMEVKPVPIKRVPIKRAVMVQHKSPSPSAPRSAPAKLITAGAPRIAVTRHEALPQPIMVAHLDEPANIALPQVSDRTVAEAPQPKVAGFGGTVAAGTSGHTVIAQGAGFGGSGSGSGRGNGVGNGTVLRAGFGSQQAAPKLMAVAAKPETTPVIVLSRPPATYTEAARQARVQGEVELRVCFHADGRVEVIEMLRGLGHGLDENAISDASAIRFKPATSNGKPIDFVTTVHIAFELA